MKSPQLDLAFKPLTPPPLVLSYGAGVDSIAMLGRPRPTRYPA
jgi:hypothetical protein